MKKIQKRVYGKVYGVLLSAVICGLTTTSVIAGGLPFASGHGNLTSGGELRTFSFVAMQKKDGSSSGQIELTNRGSGNRYHGTVDCIDISGPVAVVSGIITQRTDDFENGRGFWFKAMDNGEGANDPADSLTQMYTNLDPDPNWCLISDGGLDLNLIEGGNIQVRQ